MSDEEKKLGPGDKPVDPRSWFLEAPIYASKDYKFANYDKTLPFSNAGFAAFRKNLMEVAFPEYTIDIYCPTCKKETVFAPKNGSKEKWTNGPSAIVPNEVFITHFKCSRQHCGYELVFIFKLDQGVLTKIGQFPSIADLLSPKIQKYSKVLDSSLMANWQRAIGLKAHGVGAGSYVYLRRIIEAMLNEAAEKAIAAKQATAEQLRAERWPEKVKLLANYLPTYLVENAIVYSVLSKGVHELSESECADYFDVMHTSIEIICEEKLAVLERENKANSGKAALQKVLQTIHKKN